MPYKDPEIRKQRKREIQKRFNDAHPNYHQSGHGRDVVLLRRFGITHADFERMSAEQEGRCYICGGEETTARNGRTRQLSIDHNHETGKVRHLLCSFCNCMIGYAKENPLTLEKAAAYLRSENAR
jgi:hypothetical protein